MAILCDGLKLLFIQTPHTGCTAIGTLLRRRFDGVRVPEQHVRRADLDGDGGAKDDTRIVAARKHATLRQLMDAGLITAGQRKGLVVAAGVRNPYDMLASEFVRTTGTEDPRRRKGTIVPRRDRFRKGARPTEFEAWLRWRFAPGLTGRLQGAHHVKPPDFAEGADQVIRFERLQEDFDALMKVLGVTERVEVPVVNPTVGRKGRHYSEFYTPAARRIVDEVYDGWIGRFGYHFDDPP